MTGHREEAAADASAASPPGVKLRPGTLHRWRSLPAARTDRVVTAAFALFAFWGWFNYCFGPVVPLLREELGTTRAMAGLHGTALALGGVVAGLASGSCTKRFGRLATLLGGIAAAATGMVAVIMSRAAVMSLGGALVAGMGGFLAANVMNATITEHHGSVASATISRVNAVSSLCGIAAPLALGAALSTGLGWRAAFAIALPLGALALGLLWWAREAVILDVRETPQPVRSRPSLPVHRSADTRFARQRKPAAFWATWVVMILIVGVEVSVTFWGVDYMRLEIGLSAGQASFALSALLFGMMLGRALGASLTTKYSGTTILMWTFGLSYIGWFIFWASRSMLVAFLGLLILGCGLALQFPVVLALLFASSNGDVDRATGWVSIALGAATGSVPVLGGWLADELGSRSAFLVTPALLAGSALLLMVSPRPLPADRPVAVDPGSEHAR